MKVVIYSPAKTATQSGSAKTKRWLVRPEAEDSKFVEPVMGWTANSDTREQLALRFASKEDAIRYAEEAGHEYLVLEPKTPKIKPKSYAENFTG